MLAGGNGLSSGSVFTEDAAEAAARRELDSFEKSTRTYTSERQLNDFL